MTELLIIAAVVFAIYIFGVLKHERREKAANDASPILEVQAKVVAKRTDVSGTEGSSTTYYATFEAQDGARTELRVRGQDFGLLAEGDFGTLRHQGTRYLGFQRTRAN